MGEVHCVRKEPSLHWLGQRCSIETNVLLIDVGRNGEWTDHDLPRCFLWVDAEVKEERVPPPGRR